MPPPDLSVTEGASGLRIEHLRKSYKKRVVIRDVSMELHRGEVVGLLGPNGCGKTTTFYAIAGLVTPEAGHVFIDGREVTTLPMYRRAWASGICRRKCRFSVACQSRITSSRCWKSPSLTGTSDASGWKSC